MKSLSASLTLSFAFLCSALFSPAATPADADVSVGRWCDRMLPGLADSYRIVEIVHREGGAIEMRYVFMDGTNDFTGLQLVADDLYALMGSPFGDHLFINSLGNLEMFDEDGLIRVAERLGDSPRSGECS